MALKAGNANLRTVQYFITIITMFYLHPNEIDQGTKVISIAQLVDRLLRNQVVMCCVDVITEIIAKIFSQQFQHLQNICEHFTLHFHLRSRWISTRVWLLRSYWGRYFKSSSLRRTNTWNLNPFMLWICCRNDHGIMYALFLIRTIIRTSRLKIAKN